MNGVPPKTLSVLPAGQWRETGMEIRSRVAADSERMRPAVLERLRVAD